VAGNSLGGWVALELAKAGRALSVAGLSTAGLPYVTSLGFEGANAAMRAAVFSGVERVSVPVTLARAELDRLLRRPRETAPGWRTLTLSGCGHIPTWDDPEQVAEVLLRASS
jgi:pimeloyl-ACP methyl ester carboxylesterase